METGYRFIEHVADVGIEIRSPGLSGIFETAAEALFVLIAPRVRNAEKKRVVESEGDEPELLLVNFLNDLLFVFETDRLLFRRVRTLSMDEGKLVIEGWCEHVDAAGVEVDTVVKAATFHNVLVKPEDDGWRAVVYLDL